MQISYASTDEKHLAVEYIIHFEVSVS